ncbi:MAG TPA: alpha/beta hydrolase [Ramlibacter sp.]|nr:alpha/beta hydrolase [Ramlibacter sp.]
MTDTLSLREVRIPTEAGAMHGDLAAPADFNGVVLFVNGRGCGRHGVEDRLVASQLQRSGVATLLLDLLTIPEQQAHRLSGVHGVDVALLTERTLEVVNWISDDAQLRGASLGLCGVSAGSPAALIVAARLGKLVHAVVSVGGRPDQAGAAALAAVKAPTLMLVGSLDSNSSGLNEGAYQHLRGERSVAVVPGGGALLEEPGVLAHAALMAADWFTSHLDLPVAEMA